MHCIFNKNLSGASVGWKSLKIFRLWTQQRPFSPMGWEGEFTISLEGMLNSWYNRDLPICQQDTIQRKEKRKMFPKTFLQSLLVRNDNISIIFKKLSFCACWKSLERLSPAFILFLRSHLMTALIMFILSFSAFNSQYKSLLFELRKSILSF